MNKFFNGKMLYIFFSVALLIIIFLLSLRGCTSQRDIRASVSPAAPFVGQEVYFSDSTAGARNWYWEFGDGAFSDRQSGKHTFRQEGGYRIRLTINRKTERFFDVMVKKNADESDGLLIRIVAPSEAIQGENIVFRGEGNDEQWRWEFGESGMIDSREKTTIYTYSEPGSYEVLLNTENTKYPIRHRINVLPYYSENDTTDMMVLIGLDIKEKLQNIVDGKPFNTNYNHVVNKYFNGNSNTLVTINNNKHNDFYSYCQGLRHIGRKSVNIETVLVESDSEESGYVSRIAVIQTDKKK